MGLGSRAVCLPSKHGHHMKPSKGGRGPFVFSCKTFEAFDPLFNVPFSLQPLGFRVGGLPVSTPMYELSSCPFTCYIMGSWVSLSRMARSLYYGQASCKKRLSDFPDEFS